MVRHHDKKRTSRAVVKSAPAHAGGPFRPGNQVALGNGDAKRKRRAMTQALISELYELDPETKQEKFRTIVKRLVARAMQKDQDHEATKLIFDRVDGKMFGLPGLDGGEGEGPIRVTLRIGHQAADGSKSVAEMDLTAEDPEEVED